MRKMFMEGTLNGNTNVKYGVDELWTSASDVPVFQDVAKTSRPSLEISPKQVVFYLLITLLVFMMGAAIYKKVYSTRYLSKSDTFGIFPISQKVSAREDLTREAVIALTNAARAENGLAPLAENQLLNRIAEARASDMLEKQYFAHVSPTGQQASDIAQNIGYHYKIISENIGSGDFYTNRKIVDGWMQSPGHRNNILSAEVQEIGVAVLKGRFRGAETYLAVQIFGLQSLPVSQNICVAPSDTLRIDIEVKKVELENLQEQLRRLKTELDDEQEAIETDQKHTYNDARKIQKLNERINVFNEKSRWYNRLAGEAKAKASVMESMINEYNNMLTAYHECSTAH